MLQHLRASGRVSAAALFTALAASVSCAVSTAQQPVRPGASESHPPSVSLPKGARTPLTALQKAHVAAGYASLPLRFERNQGQAPAPIRFLSMYGAYELALTSDQLVLNLKDHGVKTNGTDGLVAMRLLGGNPHPEPVGEQELPGKVNYFLGNKAEQWHTNISTFSRVRLKSVYPGVDLVYYGSQKQLEYDFVLQPGAKPEQVRLGFTGARSLHLEANGDLLLRAKAGEMRWKRPDVYQMIDGKRHAVAAHYTLRPERQGQSQIGFDVAQYDHSRPLVIDPALLVRYYNTLSSASDAIDSTVYNSMVADAAGNVYATATTSVTSAVYATATSVSGATSTSTKTFGKLPSNANATAYLLALKLDATGAMVYSDIIGSHTLPPDPARPYNDSAQAIAVDNAGNAYILGSAQAPDMPLAGSSYQTFIGFPGNTNNDSLNRHVHRNAYIAKLNPTGSALLYSTYFGGRAAESGLGIAVTPNGSTIYLSGATPTVTNFPLINGFQTTYGGSFDDGYLARLDDTGTGANAGTAYNSLVYSTLMGGGGPDTANAVAIDPANSNVVYVVGDTEITSNSPPSDFFHSLTVNGFLTSFSGGDAGFLIKVDTNASGASSFKYGTFIGGPDRSSGASVAVNPAHSVVGVSSGVVYVSGETNATSFGVTANALQSTHGGTSANDNLDAYLLKVDTNQTGAASKLYASYLGGGGTDYAGGLTFDGTSVYVAGRTSSIAANGAFPTTNAVFTTDQGGSQSQDAFVAKFTETNAATHAHAVNFSTYLGATLDEGAAGVDVDSSGNIYVMGDVLGGTNQSLFFSKLTINTPPVANAQSVTVTMNTAKSITLTSSDADGDTRTYVIVTNPGHGSLSGLNASTGAVTYTPTSGYSGPDSFTFKANDGHDDSNIATVTITVVGAPTANAQTVAVSHNTAKAITLTGSDPNTPPKSLTYIVTAIPTHGALSGTAPNVTYTPNSGYAGSDFFQFKVNNGFLDSNVATVTLNVAAGAPTANAQTVTVLHNTAKAITLTGSDPNTPPLPLIFAIATNPSHGTLSGLNASTGAVTYTPSANYGGSDSFTFTVNNGSLVSTPATVTLNVNAAAPVANPQTIAVAHNTSPLITLTGSDPNVPALTPLTFSVTVNPTHGTLSGTAPSLNYTPNAGFAGQDTFQFTVTNTGSTTSSPATVTLNVASGNPTANPQTVAVAHNTATGITLTGSDPNVPAQTLTFAIGTSPAHGALSGFNATTGAVTYTPSAGYAGPDSFTFTVTNTGGLTSPTATVTLNVAAAAPTANAQTVSVSHDTAKAITLTGSDPNAPAQTLTFAIGTNPAHGTLSGFNAATGAVTYTPNAGSSGPDSFTFTVTNTSGLTSAAATVTLNVAAAPATAPTANAQTVAVAHNTATGITLTGSDPNMPALALTFAIGANPTHGTLSGFNAATGAVTYTPSAGYSGADSFTFTVTNTASLTSSAATVTLNVAAAAPTANSQGVSTNQDTAVGVTLTGSDPNVPALGLTYNVTSSPAHGTLSGTAPNLTYTPNAGYTGPDSFQFTVTNTAGLTSSAGTVSISVTGTVTDVTGQISVASGPFLYSRATGTYTQVLTLTNTGSSAISGPISVILGSLANATLANATGVTSAILPAGRPYINLGGLGAGASTTVFLSFTKTGAGSIAYSLQMVAGPGSR